MYQVGAGVEPRSQYNLITRNYIHDGIIVMDDGAGNSWGGNGLMIHSSNNEVSYNRFVNCVAPSSQAGNLVVRNNIFYNSGATMGSLRTPASHSPMIRPTTTIRTPEKTVRRSRSRVHSASDRGAELRC